MIYKYNAPKKSLCKSKLQNFGMYKSKNSKFYDKIFDNRKILPYITTQFEEIASSSNGRTADSDSVNLGSSPGEAAIKKATLAVAIFVG